MKRIYLKPFHGSLYLNNKVFRINNGHNIFWRIDKRLLPKGISIKTVDLDKKRDGDLYIYADVPYPWEINFWKKVFATRERNILFCFESPIVNPFSHLRTTHHFFKRVYIWDDNLVDNKKYYKFFIPQLSEGLDTQPVKFARKKFLAFINSKKDVPPLFTLLSPYKKNLYKERLRAIDYFSETIPAEFEFYGKGWERAIPWSVGEHLFGVKHYRIWKGGLESVKKIKTLANFKFCLCFENTEAPGYITEKIFDCFKAKCVPVYWGAANIADYVPENCFIDFRKFENFPQLLGYLRGINEKRYNEYIKAIGEFLDRPTTKRRWFESNFQKIIVNILEELGQK